MKSNYVVWAEDIVPGACSLSAMSGYEDDWKLLSGISVAGEFPSTSKFRMNPDDPTGILLTDSLHNLDMLIIASGRLCEVMKNLNLSGIEYLPVTVYNHKNKPTAESYSVINLLDSVDCLVLDACEPRWGRIDKTDISRLKRLVIDESRIDPTRMLFRPKHFKSAILIHRKVVQKIETAACTGIRWIELEDYPEI
jgi:hypothetical protein